MSRTETQQRPAGPRHVSAATTKETVFRADRAKVVLRTAFVVVLVAGFGTWFLDLDPRLSRAEPWEFKLRFVGVAIVAAISVIMVANLLRLAVDDRALVLDDRGLLDRTVGFGLIPWERIEAIEIKRFGGIESLQLRLNNLDEFVGQLPAYPRLVARLGLKYGLIGLRLRMDFVLASPEEVKAQIEQRLAAT